MPVPIFLAAAAGIAALLGAGAAVWRFNEAKGKSLVLLGGRKSGKTTFATYLSTGSIPEGYTPTTEPERFKKELKFRDYALKVQVTDLSGAKSEWGEWKRQASEAHLICFLASWEDIDTKEDFENVERAAMQVGSWDLSAKKMLVVTFADKSRLSSDAILADPRVAQLRRVLDAQHAVPVDQTNEDSRSHLGFTTLKAFG